MASRVTSGARLPKQMGLTHWALLNFYVLVILHFSSVSASPQRPPSPAPSGSVVTFGEGGNVIDCRRPTLAYFPDPDDCRNFYHCSDWTGLQKKSCGNLFFNPTTGVCDWPATVSRLRPECASAFGASAQPPVTGIPKAFQSFTTEEREALKIIQLANNPVRFPEESNTTPPPPPPPPRPVGPAPAPVQNNFNEPIAAVLDSFSAPINHARLPPPPPPPPPPQQQRPVATQQTFRQPLPQPPPPPPQAQRVNPFDEPLVRPVQPQESIIRIPPQSVQQNTFAVQQPQDFEEIDELTGPVQPPKPTTIRLVGNPQLQQQQQENFNIRTQPKQLPFGEAQPPAPPRGAVILPPAPPQQQQPFTTFASPPPPPTTFQTQFPTTITPPQSESPTEVPPTSFPETTTRPFLARQPTHEPSVVPDESHRVKIQQQNVGQPQQQEQPVQHNRVRIVESQQQHPVVVEEIEVDENLEEVVETPAPVRHRVPIASRQPLPEVVRHSEAAPVAETSTEAEVSSPSTTSKAKQINRERYSTPSPRPEFSRQRRPLARQPVPSTEAPTEASVKTEARPTSSLRSRFQARPSFAPNRVVSRTTEQPATDDAFLVCSGDTCFDPTIIENEDNVPDLNAAASARLPDDNLRLIFEQMTLRQNQENKDQEAGNSIRLLLEAAKVEPTDAAVKVEDPELEGEESVEELQAEKLDEEDKSSPSTLFKPAAARPKLVLPVRVPEDGKDDNVEEDQAEDENTVVTAPSTIIDDDQTTQKALTLEESFTTEEVRSHREITTSSPSTSTEFPVNEDFKITTTSSEDVEATTSVAAVEVETSVAAVEVDEAATSVAAVEAVTSAAAVEVDEAAISVAAVEVEEAVTTQVPTEKNEDFTTTQKPVVVVIEKVKENEEENLVVIVPSEVVATSPPEETTETAAVTTTAEAEKIAQEEEVSTEAVVKSEDEPEPVEEQTTHAPVVTEAETEKVLNIEPLEVVRSNTEESVDEVVATIQPEVSTLPIEEQEEQESLKEEADEESATTTVQPAPATPSSLEALFNAQNSGDAIDMFISIMQNIDLKTLVSIANDPIENEVDTLKSVGTTTENLEENPATDKPFTLGQILTGETSISAVTTVQAAAVETEPVSTLPSAAQPTTTDPRPDESQLTTTDEKEQFTDTSIVRVENGVHVVMPVGWFEPNEEKKDAEEVADPTTTTAPVPVTFAATTTTAPEVETAPAVVLTTVPAEATSTEHEEDEKSVAATTAANAVENVEQLTTTESGVVVIINGEVVPTTTAPSSEVEASLTTTNVVTTTTTANIPETDRSSGSGRKTLPRVFKPRSRTSTTTTTLKSTTTEDEREHEGEGERSRFANQRNRIRERLRGQHSGTSPSKALEILNSRAKTEQKQKTTEEPEAAVVETEDASEAPSEAEEASEAVAGADVTNPPKIKKERTKLNVPKLVDRRNELFKKRVHITHPPPVKSEATEPAPASTATPKAIFANPARRPFKFSPSAGTEAIATELTATSDNVSTASPESATKPKSVRCRLFRRACTDEDASTTS